MPSFHPTSGSKHQQGGALLVMLVILVMGITTVFIASLNGTAIQNKRNQTTADALAQAKEALIGYAVSDANRPGELPCPDTNDDGSAESSCSDGGGTLIGRLPWRTLDLPDPRDGAAEKLWYVVSENFHHRSTPNPPAINSDTTGTISVNGISGYAAIILAPGAPLPNQSRPASPTGLNASAVYLKFLEDISQTSVTTQAPNDIPGGTYTYNDQSLALRPADFMPLLEKRIVREAKKCLDDFAADSTNTLHKYPWAAQLSDANASPNRNGTFNARFGRFPDTPNISTSVTGTCSTGPLSGLSSAQLATLNDYIQLAQNALNAYTGPGVTGSALNSAGDNLKDLASSYGLPWDNTIRATGQYIDNQCFGDPKACYNTSDMQTKINASFAQIRDCTGGSADSTMPSSWSSLSSTSCQQLVGAAYWAYWRDLLFMQIADGYQPGGAGSCTTNTTCLSVSGSGNINDGSGSYHAVVAIARGITSGNTSPRAPASISDYLEGINKLDKTGAAPAVAFETYRSDDANYGTINDLVFCLDGYDPVNNQNANCK